MAEQDLRLRTAEAAELAGVQPGTWRDYVSKGRAPQPDGHYDARSPYWLTSTVNEFMQSRPGQGRPRPELAADRQAKPRRTFSPEFKAEMVRDYRASGSSIRQFALAHGLTESALASWIRQADQDASPAPQ